MITDKILESAEYVVDHADLVHIDMDKLREFSASFEDKPHDSWLANSLFDIDGLGEEKKLMLITIFNAISFSYWGEPYWNVEYKGVLHTRGSWSLVASIFRAREEENDIFDPYYLASLSRDQLAIILRGNTEIPLIEERVKILNEIGSVLVSEFDGKMSNLVRRANNDAIELVELILKSFSSFRDTALYKSQEIYFEKRAQALTEGIYSIFDGKGLGDLKNIESLTACADYIIPNLLRGLGILTYASSLAEKIDHKIQLPPKSPEEVEIRAHTIWTVELIRRSLEERGLHASALHINDYLWTIGGNASTPFHMTRTTSY